MGAAAVDVLGTTGSKGSTIASVYAAKTSDNVRTFSFHSSFLGEQVNASIQALPADTVRHAYVHTVFNEISGKELLSIHPWACLTLVHWMRASKKPTQLSALPLAPLTIRVQAVSTKVPSRKASLWPSTISSTVSPTGPPKRTSKRPRA